MSTAKTIVKSPKSSLLDGANQKREEVLRRVFRLVKASNQNTKMPASLEREITENIILR